ncbi:hypothetical protein ACS0TY_011603 [Phlomoides rotata]
MKFLMNVLFGATRNLREEEVDDLGQLLSSLEGVALNRAGARIVYWKMSETDTSDNSRWKLRRSGNFEVSPTKILGGP